MLSRASLRMSPGLGRVGYRSLKSSQALWGGLQGSWKEPVSSECK